MVEPYLESFSREYSIVQNATIRTWDMAEAHMDVDLYNSLAERVGDPVVGLVDGCHYYFKPSKQVLSGECAVPGTNRASDPSALLVMK